MLTSGLTAHTQVLITCMGARTRTGGEVVNYVNKRTLRLPLSLITPYRPEKLQALYVSGDSMKEANINNGDIIIFYPGL